jgi:RNA polymerase sigma factor (sigma-70 family)
MLFRGEISPRCGGLFQSLCSYNGAAGGAARSQQRPGGDPMESGTKETLLDADGRPLDPRIQAVLRELVPRFRHRFLTLRDELLVTEIFEEAGRLIAEHKATFDGAENPRAYAFKILCTVALLRLRHSSMRLEQATFGSDAGLSVIESQPARFGTSEQVEASILLQEYLAPLTDKERELCMWKEFGYTSREIGRKLGMSPAYVDNLFYRIKRKCQEAAASTKAAADSTPGTSHVMKAPPM